MSNSKKLQNCTQNKCAFLQMGVGCKPCDDCKAESYILDDDCHRCWNCSKDAGILRWDDGSGDEIEQKQLQLVKMK